MPAPAEPKLVFPGIGFDEVYKLLDGLRRHRGVDGEHGGGCDGERDRFEVLDRVVGDAGEQRRIDDMGAKREQDGVAVGRRLRHLTGADIAARAGDVLDVELLAERLGEFLRHEAREGVGHPAGRKSDDRAHRTRRIGLCPRDPRNGRQRSSTCCQVQKFAAGKSHGVPFLKCGARRLIIPP